MYVDASAAEPFLEDLVATARRVVTSGQDSRLVIVLEESASDAARESVQEIEGLLGAAGAGESERNRIRIHRVSPDADALVEDRAGQRTLLAAGALELLGDFEPAGLDIVIPPASTVAVDATGLDLRELTVRILRWILAGMAVPTTDEIEQSIRTLTETLRNA